VHNGSNVIIVKYAGQALLIRNVRPHERSPADEGFVARSEIVVRDRNNPFRSERLADVTPDVPGAACH
jgi:nitrite reductase/ring-hydroxylating ferredoxin subunit